MKRLGGGDIAGAERRTSGIVLKSAREIELMREAGRLVCRVLDRMERMVAPGVTTGELNVVAERLIADAGGVPLFKGVRTDHAKTAFPAALCTSVNEEVVHGIPGSRRLEIGDIVSVDCGVRLNGYCGDSARTFAIGRVEPEVVHLMNVTRQALDLALAEIRPGRMWSEIARQMQALVENERLSVVREFVGHGIGRDMHEEPKVANYHDRKQKKADFALQPGLTMAVEPMVVIGAPAVEYARKDRWAVVTKDGSYAAHFEHTVSVTLDGVDVLTNGC